MVLSTAGPSTRRIERTHGRLARAAAGRRRGLPEPQVLVDSPTLRLERGDLDQPFHAASIGKLMTTALVLMLVDQGRLQTDSPLGALLPARDLVGLPAAPGVDVARDVTVEHLLTHTAGLPDYAEPPRHRTSAAAVTALAADPDRRWTPADLLDEARRLPAVGRPGARFRYGDTGFVLLGRVVEELHGEAFPAVMRRRVLDPCGMERSSMPYVLARTPQDVADLDVAPFWVGPDEVSTCLSVSMDWAGGGVVATPGDLVRFSEALHAGRLVPPGLLRYATRPRHRFRPGIHYGAGTMTLRFGGFSPFLRGLPVPVGHLGILSTHLFFYPRQRAHVVLNLHGTAEMRRSVIMHVHLARLLAASASVGVPRTPPDRVRTRRSRAAGSGRRPRPVNRVRRCCW
ncbi:serine hydrolase [Isoptericola sp. 178]|uniref:serine hydrolase domain-containing protein n=1 Tax=Isoptericola sp. 178 TaxID=3064651 RepID=UPI0027136F47|nr:serine hydrolase domain-containing protein [Isoptericola sp. 178]MDO8145830.1 serine hydrolase domain-containing protein [Isoptericola sp. 178]